MTAEQPDPGSILARQDAAERIGLFRAGRLVTVLEAVPERIGHGEEVLTICPKHPDVPVIDCTACDGPTT